MSIRYFGARASTGFENPFGYRVPMASGGQEASPEGASVRGLGQIEYRLARDSAVREFRRGRRSRLDICDAQPELMRVAQNLGRWTETDCPICEDAKLVNVAFAFGPGLPPSGRALSSEDELRRLAKTTDDVSFYVVEVCIKCSWNHLLRMFSAAAVRRGLPGRSR